MRYLLLFILSCSLFAETEFAKPIPSLEHPRKIIFSITQADDKSIHHALSSANNILKFYGPEKVEMEIVAYSGGIRALLKKNKKIAERVETLMLYDVLFIACNNTMRTKNIAPEQLIEGVEIVTAGIAEIIERSQEGWIYIKP